jgi:hypothetical protein
MIERESFLVYREHRRNRIVSRLHNRVLARSAEVTSRAPTECAARQFEMMKVAPAEDRAYA